MSLYTELMSLGGVLTLLGIFLTWSLSRIVEKFRLGGGRLSLLILIGGLLTAVGFTPIAWNDGDPLFWAVLLGPALIAYALAESGLVRAKQEMLLQSALAFLAVVMMSPTSRAIAESFSAIAIVILMNALVSYAHSPQRLSALARTASWLFVLFLILENISWFFLIGIALYFVSLSIWLYALFRFHAVARERFANSVQEGL